MINSRKVLYSSGNNDECYTPRYVVEEILPYIPKDKTIWCPFDTEASEFVKVLTKEGGGIMSFILTFQQVLIFILMSLLSGILYYRIHHSQVREKYSRERYLLINRSRS